MLALVLAMLMCVALGAGVVGYVMIEARREGRGQFWTPEGEELIAGARRRGEQVRSRGEQLGRSAAERTQSIRQPRRQPPAEDAAAGATATAATGAPAAASGSGSVGAQGQAGAGARAGATVPAGSETSPAQQGAEDARAEDARAEDARAEEYRAAS